MEILFTKSLTVDLSRLKSLTGQILGKLFPGHQCFNMPGWLTGNEVSSVLEKEGNLIFVCLWHDEMRLESLVSLFQLKLKWEHFLKNLDKGNQVTLVILGERIPDALVKLCASVKEEVLIYELIFAEEEKVWVRELSTLERDSAGEKMTFSSPVTQPNQSSSEFLSGHDVSLTSYFYKMGKLSEEELTRFLELESDLYRRNR